MRWKTDFQRFLRTLLTGHEVFVLDDRVPQLAGRFDGLDGLGLYLHIPFCRQICPYCPYNKELYRPETALRYAKAVIKEIENYARLIRDIPITSFYIGGGTPTTMLFSGLEEILNQIYCSFKMQCEIHMESHPNDLTERNLARIASLGVAHLSIGVEALQDHHLETLSRPYTVDQARAAVSRAVDMGFTCVNADFMFALPAQTQEEVEQTASELIALGVDQVAAYPLFSFPYTRWFALQKESKFTLPDILQRRRMFKKIERSFRRAGYERTSVWAFTRRGIPKYCSVTVPRYIGLGASGGSYLDDVLYFNTFNVNEYIAALERGGSPIGLSMELSRRMQMAGWLYWRIYETRFRKSDFQKRFGEDFDLVYGFFTGIFANLGLLRDEGDEVELNDRGAYWLHALQDLFSIDYVSKLWGISKQDPWPRRVVL
jgi:coproporphyrinogen III oxidase-like Fe-S oxidoreductase